MAPRQITHKNVFRVLAVGFGLAIALLLGASLVGLRNIQSIQENAARLVREQSVAQRLIRELRDQQTSVREVFSLLARDPDSVDSAAVMTQLRAAQDDIDRISAEGLRTPERDLWERLQQRSLQFSNEARRLVLADNPQSFASFDLFRYHESFTAVIANLIEREYGKVSAAQSEIDARSARLLRESAIFAGASMLLALALAFVTLRMAIRLIREMEWQTAELARVSWHMLQDQEAAARRFSHELHDELGQSLTAIKTNLAALGQGNGSAGRLNDCLELVDEAIGNVRQLSQLLRPTILDDFGLEAGLRWLCDGFAARTGIDVHVESTHPGRLPDETETHLFRIAQEALTNIARHSGAKSAWISLDARDGSVTLSIRDDGRGLEMGGASGGMGMVGMRARARSMGGDVNVRSNPGAGVLIEVRVPNRDETHSHTAG